MSNLITHYSFGKMVIGGITYTSDLIIFPDKHIQSNWFRKAGHVLEREDLDALLARKPELIIAGSGASGRMVLAPALEKNLAQNGIEIRAMATADAVGLYNRLTDEQPELALGAGFHLTC